LRQVLPAAFPEDVFYFQAADIVTQILNFGLPAQIDVRTVGYGTNNLSVAKQLRQRLAAIPGIVDAHLQQEVDAPAFYAQIDRTRGRPAWPQCEHGGHQHQCQPEFLGAGVAEFLDRSGLGHSVLSGGADARVQSRLAECAGNTPVSTSLAVSGQTVPGNAQQCRDVQTRHRLHQFQPDQYPAGV